MDGGNEAKVTVQSELLRIVEDLQKISKSSDQVAARLKEGMDAVGDAVDKETKRVETGMEKLKKFGRSVADRLKNDFKSLASINSVAGALKLSNQFSGSIKETVNLSDTIRKLGATFGIAGKDFASFQSKLTKGLGSIGLSSDVAARTLEGLAEVPVRGQENLEAYSKTAGELASIGGEKGREGDIARSIARVIQARGGNVNDIGQMKGVAEDVRRARVATGKGPSELLKSMEDLFTGMSQDFRKRISTRGLATIAAAGAVAGPNATSFLQDYLRLSGTQRAGIEARTGGALVSNNGVNTQVVSQLFAEAKKLGGGDIRLGVKAATGIDSDEAAEGFIRLAESLEQVKRAQEGVEQANGDLDQQYRSSMGLGEAFSASINRVKKTVSGPLSDITQKGTDLLSKAAQSDLGSAGVVAGGATLAALLAGGGLRGIGGELRGEAKAKAIEAATGEHVQRVEVINWPAEGLGGAMGGGGLGGKLGKAGAIGGAAVAAYELLDYANESTKGKTSEGFEGTAVERLFFKLDKLLGGQNAQNIMKAQKVEVELKSKDLRNARKPGRGSTN